MDRYNRTDYAVKQMTGYCLARNGRTASQRAAIAAGIVLGEIELAPLTKKQIALLAGVSVSYVDRAIELSPLHRKLMAKGDFFKIADFQVPTDTQLQRTVKAAGVDRVWDVMEPFI
jgi:hypothetical protein